MTEHAQPNQEKAITAIALGAISLTVVFDLIYLFQMYFQLPHASISVFFQATWQLTIGFVVSLVCSIVGWICYQKERYIRAVIFGAASLIVPYIFIIVRPVIMGYFE